MRVHVYLGTGNHGCRDALTLAIRPRSRVALVQEVDGCTSCWQVGHDSDHTPFGVVVGDQMLLLLPPAKWLKELERRHRLDEGRLELAEDMHEPGMRQYLARMD